MMEAKRKRFTREDALKIQPGGFLALPEVQEGFGVRCSKGGVHSWVLRYTLRGRRRWIALGRVASMKLSVAEAAAEDVRGKVARDIDPLARKRGEDVTVTDFAKDYLKRHAKPHKKASSVSRDEELLRLYIEPAFGRRLVSEVTERDVRELHHSLAKTPIRANRVASLLSSMLDRAMAWGVIPKGPNPASGRKDYFYPEKARQRYLTADEFKALWAVLDRFERTPAMEDHARIVKLLLLTGCRRSEILRLRWSEVRLEERALHLPHAKTGFRAVALTSPAVAILKGVEGRLEDPEGRSEWVFPGVTDSSKPRGGFERAWEKIRDAAELADFRCHDLRHSYASAAVRAGVPLNAISKLLGHASVLTSSRYAHIPSEVVEASAALVGDRITAMTSGGRHLRLVR